MSDPRSRYFPPPPSPPTDRDPGRAMRPALWPVWITFAIGCAVLVVLALMAGCRPPAPPVVTPQPDRTAEFQQTCRDVYVTQLLREPDPEGLAGCINQARAGKTKEDLVAWIRSSPEYIALHTAPPVPSAQLHGRIRTTATGLANEAGPFRWFGLSEFDLLFLVKQGQRDVVLAQLDAAARVHATVVRVFGSASILFRLTPDDPGYDAALTWLLEQASARGLYVNLVVFCDAQILYPKTSDRTRVLAHLADRFGREPGIIWSVANEPSFNGWSRATDPALLQLADQLAAALGHRDFIVGDPPDGDDPDASASTIAQEQILAAHANLLTLHSSRKGGAAPDGSRLRRWIDHLESGSDIAAQTKRRLIHDEPMGHASHRWVPLPNGTRYEREYDPDVAIAAGLTAIFTADGYIYHRIRAQDSGTPGLQTLGDLLQQIPVGGCRYLNDSWSGAPSHGFTWPGKVRHYVCGTRAWTLAYGLDRVGTITWQHGWHPVRTLYQSPEGETGELARSKVAVYELAQ